MTSSSSSVRLLSTALSCLVVAVLVAATSTAGADSPAGRWRYQWGGFTDDITLWPDGRAIGKDPTHVGQWKLQGSTIITRWPNGYRHEFPAQPSAKQRIGQTFDPQGVAHRTTLTWLGPPPPPASPPAASPPAARSLTGAWVHSADPEFKTHDSKVIVIQDGSQVTLTLTYKYKGRWITWDCRGPLSGNRLLAKCKGAPGGDPFGFYAAESPVTWVLSGDGNHLDYDGRQGGQESHFSRIP